MALRYLTAFITFMLCGCHFFEPRDTSSLSPINAGTDLKDLSGTWKATELTYDLLKEKKYPLDSVTLKLAKDSTFVITNLPDCIDDTFGESVKGKLLNANGKWQVYHTDKEWTLRLAFSGGDSFSKQTSIGFSLVRDHTKLKAWQFVGDPDGADILEFERAK